jgi:hypothetical protein
MSDTVDPSYAAYLASLEPCPECGRVDEMDNIEGKLLCAACYLDEQDDDGCECCGAHIDAEGACENCWGVDDDA